MTVSHSLIAPIGLQVSYHTSQGARARNEDWIGGYVPADPRWQAAKGGCFVVADGFGGRRGGVVASRLTGETVLATYFRTPTTDVARALGHALLAANQRVSEVAARDRDLSGMASTVVAAAVRGPEAAIAHMGDSRAYLVRHQTIYPLTRDHSWVQEMMDAGVITARDAANHPYRNVVTRYAGIGQGGAPDVRRLRLQPGDALLLCSDGISDRVPIQELGSMVNAPVVHDPAYALTRRAAALGTRDNVSAIVVRYLPWAGRQPRAPAGRTIGAGSARMEPLPALIYGGALFIGGAALGALLTALLT
jgi:protein phosphatase